MRSTMVVSTPARSRGSSSSSAVCSTRGARSRRTNATIPASAKRRRRRGTRRSRQPVPSTRRRRSSSSRRRGRRCAGFRPTSGARSSTTSRASTVQRRRSGAHTRRRLLRWMVLVPLVVGGAREARAQTESPEVLRAIELENAGKYREAVPIYREAMRTHPTPIVVLGLERSYAELGMSDSLLAPLDTVLTRFPREPLYHVVHLRTFQILRRYDALRGAFERWVHDDPTSSAPYGEYARVLIQLGRPASADSIIERAKTALGSTRDLQYETAQLRAAMGEWEPSASAWRRALANDPHLSSAASYALAPAPAGVRPALRRILAMDPPERGARRALADLEIVWGQPQAAWEALRGLPPDTASASVWEDFGERAMTEERYGLARDALGAAVRVRRTPALALRAATASLRAGAPADVFKLIPMSDWESDPARATGGYLPLHVEA